MKIRLVAAEVFHEERRTDRRTAVTKSTVALRNIANAPKRIQKIKNNAIFEWRAKFFLGRTKVQWDEMCWTHKQQGGHAAGYQAPVCVGI